MKSTLSYKTTQNTAITPELQQAIQLMQLSAQELHHEIIKNITDNPLLELDEQSEFLESFNEQTDLPLDDENTDFAISSTSAYSGFDRDIKDETNEGLRDYLFWQLNFYSLAEDERAIASYIINGINEDGFFEGDFKELQSNFKNLPINIIQNILNLIHQLDPFGVGCCNTSEFLLLQLDTLRGTYSEKFLNLADKIIHEDMKTLADHNHKKLAQKHHVDQATLEQAIDIITELRTTPNTKISNTTTDYMIPDIKVFKVDGQWIVEIINGFNHVILDEKNLKLLRQSRHDQSVRNYLKDKLYSAKWFLKCLAHREHALLAVTEAIFKHQQAFLNKGPIAIVPLTLSQVAQDIGMHESSVSRIVCNKNVETPFGLFALKYFFASHLNDEAVSNKTVTTLLKQYIAHESSLKPLSDQQLTNKLKLEHNLTVARRTVTKYRESLGILPSRLRRKLGSTH